ncbi:MAG: hypothetical protein IPH57_17520 [Saprospiraceae bacterium]|nr:hypothetical protein [Saprospiraceae bacterium]
MKNLLFLLLAIFVISCTSVSKLVDEGKYDQAINYSVNKIKGKKNKKDKYVQAIESSFAKITENDMNRIQYLKIEKNGNYWMEVYDILNRIDDRQRKIKPLLPLTSMDGYKAEFKFVKVDPLILESKEGAAKFLYDSATENLERAEQGDKNAGRIAFQEFEQLRNFYQNYKDADILKRKVYELAQERVLIDVKNLSDVILPKNFYYEIKNINTNELNRKWYKFYTTEDNANVEFDYQVNINIKEIAITPEKEKEREYTETALVKDGFEYVRDERGNVKKDSLGNDIKKEKEINVSATVFELGRFKSAFVRGDVRIYDNKRKKVYQTSPINVETVFETFASYFRGDKRALSKQSQSRLKGRIDPFPTNEELLLMSVDDLKKILYDEIDRNLRD